VLRWRQRSRMHPHPSPSQLSRFSQRRLYPKTHVTAIKTTARQPPKFTIQPRNNIDRIGNTATLASASRVTLRGCAPGFDDNGIGGCGLRLGVRGQNAAHHVLELGRDGGHAAHACPPGQHQRGVERRLRYSRW
jgi:hypothetical protein